MCQEKKDWETVRQRLRSQSALSSKEQNLDLMKNDCLQLFDAGSVSDVLLIWLAKTSNLDAHFAIDVHLLCGPGIEATKKYLLSNGNADALAALQYIVDCEKAGDFTVGKQL